MNPKEKIEQRIYNKIQEIAKEELGVVTLEQRGRDKLDFYDIHVAALLRTLDRVFSLGFRYGREAGQIITEILADRE